MSYYCVLCKNELFVRETGHSYECRFCVEKDGFNRYSISIDNGQIYAMGITINEIYIYEEKNNYA